MKECRKSIELVAPLSAVVTPASGQRSAGVSPARWAGRMPARLNQFDSRASFRAGQPRAAVPTWSVLAYPASFAANASTRIPTTIRYTAKGTNPCFRTQAMNHATAA